MPSTLSALTQATERDPELERALGLQGKVVLGFCGSFYSYEGLDLGRYALCRGYWLNVLSSAWFWSAVASKNLRYDVWSTRWVSMNMSCLSVVCPMKPSAVITL